MRLCDLDDDPIVWYVSGHADVSSGARQTFDDEIDGVYEIFYVLYGVLPCVHEIAIGDEAQVPNLPMKFDNRCRHFLADLRLQAMERLSSYGHHAKYLLVLHHRSSDTQSHCCEGAR